MKKTKKKKEVKPKLNKHNSIKIKFIGNEPVIKYEMVSDIQIVNVINELKMDLV